MVSDGCSGFWFLEWFFPAITACCTVHDFGGSDGTLLDCLQGGLPQWAWAPAAFCVALMVLFRPIWHRIKPWLPTPSESPAPPAGLFASPMERRPDMADFKRAMPGDPPWLIEAFKLLGLKEAPGPANNPDVVALFAEAGFAGIKDDATAWCAAFVGAMQRRAGYKASGSLAARSYLNYGMEVRPEEARRGDLVIFKRGSQSWQGHVAYFLADDGTHVWVLGGNQSNAVTVARYAKASLLGIRRPVAAEKAAAGPIPQPRASRPVATKPAAGALSRDLIEAVQRALITKGYHEVGEPDGLFGRKTRGAILAFQADNGQELTGQATAELVGIILSSPARPISMERASGKPADNPVVKDSNVIKTIGGVLGGGSLVSMAEPIVTQIEGGAGIIARLRGALEPLTSLWPILVIGGVVAVIYLASRSEKAVVKDYQSGKLAR